MDLRTLQRPLKQAYRDDPAQAKITLSSGAVQGEQPVYCSVHVGEQAVQSEAHPGVGGPGTAACSGDLLLGSLAACAQITCQMVATAMNLPFIDIRATAHGDLDLRGTLGVDREAPVGFTEIRLKLDIDAPELTAEQRESLIARTEQYCVVMQTLTNPPRVTVEAS